jgi:hypothetical protein
MNKQKMSAITVSVFILAMLGIVSAVGLGVFASSNPTISCPGALSAPKVPSGSTSTLSIQFTAIADEDGGAVGYWALDHLYITLQVYHLSNGSYYFVQHFTGVFDVPQGATSPGNALIQQQALHGTVNGYDWGPFTGTFIPGQTGNLGVMNQGGTTSNILLGTYGAQGNGGTGSDYFWQTTYFSSFVQPAGTGAYAFIYNLNSEFHTQYSNNAMCDGSFNPSNNGISGDISSNYPQFSTTTSTVTTTS